MNLNKVFVLGNLTKDPEKRALPSGQSVVNFGLATNRFYKNQAGERVQDTEFHSIVIFGKMAETAAMYLKKGAMVLIEGRLKTRDWQDQSGAKHYRTEIIADSMQLGPRLSGTGQTGGYQSNSQPFQKPSSSRQQGQNIKDEEIPVIEEEAVLDNLGQDQEEIDVKNIPF